MKIDHEEICRHTLPGGRRLVSIYKAYTRDDGARCSVRFDIGPNQEVTTTSHTPEGSSVTRPDGTMYIPPTPLRYTMNPGEGNEKTNS